MTSIVIPCGKDKQAVPAPARNLYVGSSFRLARAAAMSTGLPWFILSAKYGLLHPDTVIAPYEVTYGRGSGCPASTVRDQARDLIPTGTVVSLCPLAYTDVLRAAIGRDRVAAPLTGMRTGYQRQAFARIRRARALDPVWKA